jgi:hypothetical protein
MIGATLYLEPSGIWRDVFGKPKAFTLECLASLMKREATISADEYVEIWLAGLVTLSKDASIVPRVPTIVSVPLDEMSLDHHHDYMTLLEEGLYIVSRVGFTFMEVNS